jgi:hypothetical protein
MQHKVSLTHSGIPANTLSPHTHADLKLSNGSTVGLTDTETLRTLLGRLGIEGAHTKPRVEIINAYAAKLKQIHDDAGSAAVDTWLEQHKG